MKNYVIGRYLEKKKAIAYKIYNDTTRKAELIAKDDLIKRIQAGEEIVGLKVSEGTYKTLYGVEVNTHLIENKYIFITSHTDEVDCYGNPKEKTGKYIVVGHIGFGEARIYICINSKAEMKEFTYDDFIEAIKAEKIIGAIIADDEIKLFKPCSNQYYRP
jgi:uncharacterized membrane protein